MSLGRREAGGDVGRNEPGSEAVGAAGTANTVSEPMRRVVEALLDGSSPSPTDREALTEAERAELASLVRTANLTRVAIAAETPRPAAEQASLTRAQSDLQKRVATGTLPVAAPNVTGGGGLRGWVDRLLGRTGGMGGSDTHE